MATSFAHNINNFFLAWLSCGLWSGLIGTLALLLILLPVIPLSHPPVSLVCGGLDDLVKEAVLRRHVTWKDSAKDQSHTPYFVYKSIYFIPFQ